MKYLLIVIFLAGCPRLPPAPPGPPTEDAGTDADEAKRPCLAVCRNLAHLGCEAARPTAEGTSCTRVCENVFDSPIKWNLDCRKRATSCDAVDACER
jgi:hypothetical protein